MTALRPTPAGSTSIAVLANALSVDPPAGPDTVVSGVTLDSRSVQSGDLYAALPGATTHGARFASGARDAGATAILTDPVGAQLVAEQGVVLPVLVHPEPRAVLGHLSALVYGTDRLKMPLIGITGTNGKTTTAYLIHSALVALGRQVGLIGTVETRIGDERVRSVRTTPEAPDLHALLATMAQRGMDACVMEVSSHALSQHRVDGVIYDLALFTNLSQDHLDFHHDMEDYFAAKASLFTPARSQSGLVCVDDDWGLRLAGQSEIPIDTLTTQPGGLADWTVTVDPHDPHRFVLRGRGDELHLVSALPGAFNVTNTAMAAAALLLLGVDGAAAQRAVLADPHVPGRMERVVLDDGRDDLPAVVVDYAHTPDAIRAALEALRPVTAGTLVCVTGAGGDRDRDKRAAMGRAAALADVVIVTDDNPRSEDPGSIREAVLRGARAETGGGTVLEVGDRREAIARAVAIAAGVEPGGDAPGATALVAIMGKGHETGQEIGGEVHPFDDRAEALSALEAAATQLGEASA